MTGWCEVCGRQRLDVELEDYFAVETLSAAAGERPAADVLSGDEVEGIRLARCIDRIGCERAKPKWKHNFRVQIRWNTRAGDLGLDSDATPDEDTWLTQVRKVLEDVYGEGNVTVSPADPPDD